VHPLLAVAGPIASGSSRWLGGVATGSIEPGPRSRREDAHLPWDTDAAYGGLSASSVQDFPSREHVPIVFVHGNSADARIWVPAMEWFLDPANFDDPEHPLARRDRNETPGDVDDSTRRAADDHFFPESPTLDGVVNERVETDHRGLASDEAVLRRLDDWLRPVRAARWIRPARRQSAASAIRS
jgi:hypothetical protein